MTFQQLHYILEVYRTGSISRASENLFVTRPGVSLSLRNLEAELGYPIFVRTQNGLIPSPQGELVLEYASRICETQDLINGIGQNRRNRIEIASVEYAPVQNAALRLLRENRHRRDVSFSFKSSYSDPFKKLAFFELDAVVSKRFATQNASVEEQLTRRNLAWKELHQIPVVIVIGPGHRLYREKVLQPRDFDHDVLLETPTSALGRCSFLRDQIQLDSEHAIVTNHASLKNEMLAQGLGFSIQKMPSAETIRRYGFRCIPLEGVYQRLIVATNPMRPQRPEITRFLELLDEEIAKYQDPIPTGQLPE